MGIDDIFFDADYSGIDYAAIGGRAFVSGTVAGGAGLLATLGTSAAIGSSGGPVGTAVGVVVGALVYWFTDSAIGDSVEGGIRESLGEGGCTVWEVPEGEPEPSEMGDFNLPNVNESNIGVG